MTQLVWYLLVFLVVGAFFLFFHLMMGKLIRPNKPDPEKMTIYECGEPTIGSAYIQFDLRFYVVALLFVIFDVEAAFFFPWAVVFGQANSLANENLTAKERIEKTNALAPAYQTRKGELAADRKDLARRNDPASRAALQENADEQKKIETEIAGNAGSAKQLAWLAFWDILVFFGVILVGFAYLWKRGDLDWVRSTAAENPASQ